MTTEQAKQLSETATARLMQALEQGRPDATQVAGFHAWLKLRRYVRKGEKGIVILAPMVGRKRNADSEAMGEDEQTRLFGFRAAHVFDVSQTEGEALPEFAQVRGDPQSYTDRLTQFVASKNIALEYDAGISPARGLSSGGKITLLPNLPPAEHFSVLAHEAAHELLHRGERRQNTTHIIRETEAEAVAFVVSSAIGLDTNTASSDYIQLHAGDKATLAESLTFIQQTAALILEAITAPARADALTAVAN